MVVDFRRRHRGPDRRRPAHRKSGAQQFHARSPGKRHLLSGRTLHAHSHCRDVLLAIKSITSRQRPTEGAGEGHFFASASPRYNSGFPSGHSIETFALASVFAHEYHDKFWVKFLAYAYAGGVVGARLAAKKHFPGDAMAGGAMGWFIGDYVYGKRHNLELDDKRGMLKRVLAHVEFGGPGPDW